MVSRACDTGRLLTDNGERLWEKNELELQTLDMDTNFHRAQGCSSTGVLVQVYL